MKTWSQGEVLTAADLNNNFSEVMSTGANGNTGWQTLSVSSGWTITEPFRCIRIGSVVWIQGVLTSASSGVTQNIVTLPSGFAPTQAWRFAAYDSTSGVSDRMTIQTSGVVQAPGSRTNKVYSITTSWPVI